MKLLNESDVRGIFEDGEICLAHAVELLSNHLKDICESDVTESNAVPFEPKDFIDILSGCVHVEDLLCTMELEDMVLDEVINIASKIIVGCQRRQAFLNPKIKALQSIVEEI